MKIRLVLLIIAVLGLLLLSSCGCPQGQPFIRAGVFGPGTGNQYRPCTGLPGQYPFAQGSMFISRGCGAPPGHILGGGIQVNGFRPPVYIQNQGYGNQGFSPYGGNPNGGCSPYPQPMMSSQANWDCRFPPVCQPRRGCYDPRAMRWR